MRETLLFGLLNHTYFLTLTPTRTLHTDIAQTKEYLVARVGTIVGLEGEDKNYSGGNPMMQIQSMFAQMHCGVGFGVFSI